VSPKEIGFSFSVRPAAAEHGPSIDGTLDESRYCAIRDSVTDGIKKKVFKVSIVSVFLASFSGIIRVLSSPFIFNTSQTDWHWYEVERREASIISPPSSVVVVVVVVVVRKCRPPLSSSSFVLL
jgi:hypothetical protein